MIVIMKKLYFILLVLCFTTACNFLEIDTENKIATSEVDYSNTTNMYLPVIGAYTQLRTSGMHWANQMIWAGRDDDMNSGRTDDQGDALLFSYRGGYQCPNSFWAVNNAWVTMYEIIRTCNSAQKALDEYGNNLSKNSESYATYLSYTGEITTIKAWAYYMMATTFGACVLLTDNDQDYYIRSTREHVIEYALKELDAVIPNMQRMRPNQMAFKGAVTAFTAEALAARFALLQGDYKKVEEYTDDIITNGGFALYDDYYNLFKIPGKLCNESLMEVQVTDLGNATGDYYGIDQWFNFQGASLTDTIINITEKEVEGVPTTVKDTIVKNIGGWNFMWYNPAFVQGAKDRGETERLQTSFLVGGEKTKEEWNVQGSAIWNGKAYLPYEQMTKPNTDWGRNNNVRLIRYAEVLLMNAEAKVRQGKSGDASFNLVRTRAKMAEVTGVTVEQILDERRMELCSEWGLRYTDLVRTNKAAEVLNNPALVRDFGTGDWTPEKAYWPVPGTQLANIADLALDPK